jgi:hypothetical protein
MNIIDILFVYFVARGDEVYATTSTLSTVQHKDNPDAVDRMVEDLEKQ